MIPESPPDCIVGDRREIAAEVTGWNSAFERANTVFLAPTRLAWPSARDKSGLGFDYECVHGSRFQ